MRSAWLRSWLAVLLLAGCVEVTLEEGADVAIDGQRDLEPGDSGEDAATSDDRGDDSPHDLGVAEIDVGGTPDVGTDPKEPDNAGDDSGQDGSADDAPGGEDTGTQVDSGECASDCLIAPTQCFFEPGTCVEGDCVFEHRGLDAECDDADPCTLDDRCDDLGVCLGLDVDCERMGAEGGTCVEGVCSGWTCEDDYDDCNDDLDFDGCETPLTTADDCGECDVPCTAGPNANADCSTGTCVRTCQGVWENCDGDWSNGCEIPTGVPNQCDVNGLNPIDGCWTAYCGSSGDLDARNFGTWFCFECTTCHVPDAGRCQWCSHSVGRWFPDDACSCGSSEDLVCGPP